MFSVNFSACTSGEDRVSQIRLLLQQLLESVESVPSGRFIYRKQLPLS